MNYNPMVNDLHCDMDGVLADFDEFIKLRLSLAAQTDDAIMWSEISQIPNFYYKLPPTPYANQLWTAIQHYFPRRKILTAIPRTTPIPEAERDKRDWVTRFCQEVFNGESPQVNIGPFSRDKHKHCKPGDVLIDDREDNIKEWIEAGGIGILHNVDNVEPTLEMIRKVGLLGTY